MADMIKVETQAAVGLITLDRPKALNALCDQLMRELADALASMDADPGIGAIIITGGPRAFAAGADIREMQYRTWPGTAAEDFIAGWEAVARVRKPVIAAVAGYALGGGCELAMMCDIIVAAESAQFGQPEVQLGIIPGAGGTQRLVRAVGKARAMDMILAGRRLSAREAEQSGLVSRVVPDDRLLDDALMLAKQIAAQSPTAAMLAKRAVNRAFETTLAEGISYERAIFYALFGTPDQQEGMAAFLEKRTPRFNARIS